MLYIISDKPQLRKYTQAFLGAHPAKKSQLQESADDPHRKERMKRLFGVDQLPRTFTAMLEIGLEEKNLSENT